MPTTSLSLTASHAHSRKRNPSDRSVLTADFSNLENSCQTTCSSASTPRYRWALLLGFLLTPLLVSAGPEGAWLAGIAVGADNLTRLVWATGDSGVNPSVQVQTVDSDANEISMGNVAGPFVGWYVGGMSVGPQNNLVLGWIEPTGKLYSMFRVDSNGDWAGSAVVSYIGNPEGGPPFRNPLPSIVVDSANRVWFTQQAPSNTDPDRWVGIFNQYSQDSGSLPLQRQGINSPDFFPGLAVRNESDQLIIAESTLFQLPNTVAKLQSPDSVTFFGRLTNGWDAIAVTSTPNKHIQIYLERLAEVTSHNSRIILQIWDIDENNRNLRISPEFAFESWGANPYSSRFYSASPFPGGDGLLRISWGIGTARNDAQSLMTIDPATWEIVNWVFI